ncbi:serine/threonine protein kinase [Microbacterium sp. W4I4]|uniref:serine/threonine-protein kinase n=1 Tax=Microbacterium sp. W4I4 TaxID=3042295 RepID=UPI0027892759|nr:serine/threonine-protein kinase [Microbacterium sp. W4I4]MDQ0614187.1 serine/threonine protein kinase [Microbacterium sp. W4I4]
MTRAPSPPPELPGFSYLRPLGTGGFADVFLYEQQLPKREVAVKVLLADRLTAGAAEEFTNEANVMALLSTHPAIVTIYQAGVAADGRPYLVMEYCPKPNLQIRTRKEPFSVAEALRVGVQVSGAVETAHRAGVLHRDIKPANILVTAYNRPALTDFGIASTAGSATDGEAAGMSIPWSPPESFADTPTTGVRTDVYALGATVFTLLSGRSPFERKGERNTSADLIERIERMAVPSLGRADVPDSLQATLARAMSKRPDDRYPSAVAFARALQKVQIELAHSVTPIDIVDEHPQHEGDDDDDDGLTRVREVRSINPDTQSATRPSATTLRKQPDATANVPRFESAPAPSALDETQRRTPSMPAPPAAPAGSSDDDEATLLRRPVVVAPEVGSGQSSRQAPVSSDAPDAPPAPKRSGMPWWGWVIAALGVTVLVLGIVFSGAITDALVPEPESTTSDTPEPQDPIAGIVPPVEDLKGSSAAGIVSFSWTNPDPEKGDSFVWYEVTLDGPGEPKNTAEDTVTLEGARSERTCIEVVLKRDDGRSSPQPVRGCVG